VTRAVSSPTGAATSSTAAPEHSAPAARACPCSDDRGAISAAPCAVTSRTRERVPVNPWWYALVDGIVVLVRLHCHVFTVLLAGCAGCGLFESTQSYTLLAATDASVHPTRATDTGASDSPKADSTNDARRTDGPGVSHDARADVRDAGNPRGDAGVVTLAEHEAQPTGIVHVGDSVYWASYLDLTIRTLSPAGAAETVATTASPPTDMATDGTYVYAVVGSTFAPNTTTNGLCSDYVSFAVGFDAGAPVCGAGNGSGTSINGGGALAGCSRIVVDSMHVYEAAESHYYYVPSAATAPGRAGGWTTGAVCQCTELTVTPNPGAIAVDSLTFYAVFGAEIASWPLTFTSEGSVFYQSPDTTLTINDVVLDDTYVYWIASDGTLDRLAKSSGGADAATGVTVLASGLDAPWRLALYDGYLYWTNRGGTSGPGSVARISVSGAGGVATLADNQTQPYGLYVDYSGVYWTNEGEGTVRMLEPQ